MSDNLINIGFHFYEYDANSEKNWIETKENSLFQNVKEFISKHKWESEVKNHGKSGDSETSEMRGEVFLGESSLNIIIVFARMSDLHENSRVEKLVKKFRKREEKPYKPYPMILIALEPLEEVLDFEQDNIEQRNSETDKNGRKENLETLSHIQIINSLHLDKRIEFFDSSIWHYYVPLNKNFKKNFRNVVEKIRKNYENKLYLTNIAREYIEFQSRLMLQSHLAPVGEGTHATHITPFIFHSETVMEQRAKQTLEKIKKIEEKLYLRKVKWKFLLVDDYADKGLAIDKTEENNAKLTKGEQKEMPTKKTIIQDVLKNIDKRIDDRICTIEVSPSVEDFKNKISKDEGKTIQSKNGKKKEIYDIILLDYLLDRGNDKRNTAMDVLEIIHLGKYKKELKGPIARFRFSPISVFPYAFLERIRQRGYSFHDKD